MADRSIKDIAADVITKEGPDYSTVGGWNDHFSDPSGLNDGVHLSDFARPQVEQEQYFHGGRQTVTISVMSPLAQVPHGTLHVYHRDATGAHVVSSFRVGKRSGSYSVSFGVPGEEGQKQWGAISYTVVPDSAIPKAGAIGKVGKLFKFIKYGTAPSDGAYRTTAHISSKCFPASTLISTATGDNPISEIRVGDFVWAFDGEANKGRGELALKRVSRLYRNVTEEWVRLSWFEDGERKELISTPGHHFLDEFGGFPAIDEMLANGKTTVVLSSGELAEVTAERIVYSANTAHLFEQAKAQSAITGNLALKAQQVEGWQTYNFEVEDHHTYIAGGVRVHNQSELATAVFGPTISHQGTGLSATSSVWGRLGTTSPFGVNTTGYTTDGRGNINGAVSHNSRTGSVSHFNQYGVTTVTSVTGMQTVDYTRSPGFGISQGSSSSNSGYSENGYLGSGVAATSGVWGGGTAADRAGVDTHATTSAGGTVSRDSGTGRVSHTNSYGATTTDNGNGTSSVSFGGGGGGSGKPVVIDMDGDGIELSRQNESVTNFDFDDDGYLERTAWTTGDDALLVFDLDDDGQVNQAKEIAFAEWTEEEDTDLEALATEFDTNRDQVLDNRDAGWNQFKIWQDHDTDGVVDDGEMVSLDEAGITSIGLETRDGTGTILEDGTVIHGLVDVQKSDGSIIDGADVAFAYNQAGFRSSEDENGNIVYEFENGEFRKIKILSENDSNFDLGIGESEWFGAEGNDLANILDASQKTESLFLSGGDGNDTLKGGSESDYLIGGDGADVLIGGAGHDILFADGSDLATPSSIDGGEGYDQLIMVDDKALNLNVDDLSVEAIESGNGADVISGSNDDIDYVFASAGGNDTLTGAGGDDLLVAGGGNDNLMGNAGDDSLFGEAGDDVIVAGDGDDFLSGGEGEDDLKGGGGNDTYYFNRGDGADRITDYAERVFEEEYTWEEQVEYQYQERVQHGSGKSATWVDETRTGYRTETRTETREVSEEIDGGIDTLLFGGGITISDIVLSRTANDMIVELRDEENADVISGDSVAISDWADQKNRIENFEFVDGTKLDFSQIMHGQYGLGSNDTLNGSAEGDFLSGGNGNDTLNGAAGKDIVTGGNGDDTIDGGEGKDFLFADDGDDTVYGQTGDDYLVGGDGNDYLQGGDGDDVLAGQNGEDILEGGAGDDLLLGGAGADILKGGAGDDTYVYFRGDGRDEILDQVLQEETYTEQVFVGQKYVRSGKSGKYVNEYRTETKTRTIELDGGDDTLQLGFTILLEDLFFRTQGEDLQIGVRDLDNPDTLVDDLEDQLTIRQWADEKNRIEKFEFASGLALDMSEIVNAQSGYEANDVLNGTDGGDILSGGGGNDLLTGQSGGDYLIGGDGDDTLDGGEGKDDLFGGEGLDHLSGGAGEDYLIGGAGNDTLDGGTGKDVLIGGIGDDILKGGLGDDVYIFNRGDGNDTIDESAYEQVEEEYTYTERVQKSVSNGKSTSMAWVNETRTGHRTVTRPVEGGDDTLQFGAQIDIADLIVSMSGNDLVVALQPVEDDDEVTDSVTIKEWTSPEFRVENLRFINDFSVDLGNVDHAQTGDESANNLVATNDQASWLGGGKGDDHIFGSSNDDIIFAGDGSDIINGGTGDDVYIFNRGDGHDTLTDQGSGAIGNDLNNPGGDKLLFGSGITIEDLVLQRVGNDLVVYVRDQDNFDAPLVQIADSIRVTNWASSNNRLEVLQFFNGADFAISHITNTYLGQDLLNGGTTSPVDDQLIGSSSGDWMDGFAGNDTLNAGAGNDILFGRGGDDSLFGESGDDILSGNNGNDYLSGGNGGDLIAGGLGMDSLYGDSGDDVIMGGDGDDLIDGGLGNDVIIGDKGADTYLASTGNDTYRFGYGDGKDIFKGSSASGIRGTDVMLLEDDVDNNAIWFSRDGDNLVMSLLGAEDTVIFENWYSGSNPSKYIWGFQSGDDFLEYSDVNRLVSAMASFDPNDGTTAYGVTASELPDSIQVAVDISWKVV